jgi:transcription antitermination factor NusG
MSEFAVGEVVRITGGPFMGFNAEVLAAMGDKRRAEVMLHFLGRVSRITMKFDDLGKS